MGEKITIYSQEVKNLPEAMQTKIKNYMKESGTTKMGAIKELLRYAFEKKEEKGEKY